MKVIKESSLVILKENIENIYQNESLFIVDVEDEFGNFKVQIRKDTDTIFKITCFNMDNMRAEQLSIKEVKRFLIDNNFGGFTELLAYEILLDKDNIGIIVQEYIKKVKALNIMLKFFK